MRVVALVPPPTEVVTFGYTAVRRLPTSPGCYALTNASGDILYAGQAVSLSSRLGQHLDGGKHLIETRYGRASRAHVLPVEQVAMLSAHERGWLNQCLLADGELPPLNKIEAPT